MTPAHKAAIRQAQGRRRRAGELARRLDCLAAERDEALAAGDRPYLAHVETVTDRIRARLQALAH